MKKKSSKTAKRKGAGKASQKTGAAIKFAKSEYVRTVPLHYPKPTVAISDLGTKRAEADVFRAEVLAAPAGAHLTYNHGPLIPNVEVFTVFWGTKWNASPAGLSLMSKLNGFIDFDGGAKIVRRDDETLQAAASSLCRRN